MKAVITTWFAIILWACALGWGCTQDDGPEYEIEPYGLSKAHFVSSQWEVSQTITLAPEIYGDLFGLSTQPLVVEWDITEQYLVAVQRQTAGSEAWAIGTVVAAYPVAHVPLSERDTELVYTSDSGEPNVVGSRWWERTHMDVTWSDVVPFEDHFGDDLVEEHAIAPGLPENAFVAFRYAGEEGFESSFSEGDLVGIEFEEILELSSPDLYCRTYPEATGCEALEIVIRTDYRRVE